METNRIIEGDTLAELKKMPSNFIDTIVTSPPYWGLRDYGKQTEVVRGGNEDCGHEWGEKIPRKYHHAGETNPGVQGYTKEAGAWGQESGRFCQKCGAWRGQIGLEPTLGMFLKHLLLITAELKRVLKPTGIMFWNHGDCYGGSGGDSGKNLGRERRGGRGIDTRPVGIGGTAVPPHTKLTPKCAVMQNYRLVLRMIDEQGWILRNIIVWNKPNHMPSSVKDRLSNSYEPVFMMVKNKKYWFDLDAVRVPLTKSSIERQFYPLQAFGTGLHGACFAKNTKGVKTVVLNKYAKGSAFEKRYGEPWDRFGKNTKKYKGKFLGNENAENFNSPRARAQRGSASDILGERGRLPTDIGPIGEDHNLLNNPMGKNPGDVWNIPTQPFPGAHFATFPEKLVEPMIISGCPGKICKKCGKARTRISKDIGEKTWKDKRDKPNMCARGLHYGRTSQRETLGWTDCGCEAGWESGIVLDPFMGAGTVAVVAKRLNRRWLGIEIKKEYREMAERRIKYTPSPLF